MCNHLSSSVARQLSAAVRVLKGGGIVAFPTDTVYGLGCDALNTVAVVRIFEVKHRPRHMPLPLLLADMDQLDRVARAAPEVAYALARRFWPGGLTLVLPKQAVVPDIVTARSDRVAVRIPKHPVPVFLARALGAPIVGTSANISGRPSPRTAGEVCEQLGAEVDLIIDAGECPGGVESTIVDVTGEAPRILREGAVSSDDIMSACRESGVCG